MIGLPERLRLEQEQWRTLLEQNNCEMRTACPGIIQSFDDVAQTVVVQLALTEVIRDAKNVPTPTQIPLLVDVPIVIPRAGGFMLTVPVQQGDECLVIFGDMCIDAWWQSGGVQNQVEKRRHDLSDGFAILGCWSQPKKISNYSATAAELRSEDGSVKVKLESGKATVQAPEVDVIGANQVNINGSGHTTIEGKDFLTHKHTGVQTGGGNTGGVL